VSAFDLASNTPEQRAIIEAAVSACDFDFDRILPRLLTEKGRTAVPVTWEDLTHYGAVSNEAPAVTTAGEGVNATRLPVPAEGPEHKHARQHEDARRATLGLAYYSGKIVLERSLVDRPDLAQIIFLAEAAHMIDFFVLTPEQRAAIFDLFHEPGTPAHGHGWFEETGNNDYWSWVGEAWMYGFIKAFTDIEPGTGGMHHELTESDAAGVRELLGAKVPAEPEPDPEPEPEPAPGQVCAAKFGYAYHRVGAHWWVVCTRTYPSREAAEVAGRRPCRICKP
jgi:hypothetical protein